MPNAIWVGVCHGVVTLVALDLRVAGGVFGGSGRIDEARTTAFTTLVLAQLFNCFNALPIAEAPYGTCSQTSAVGSDRAFPSTQVAVVQVPFLNNAFGTTPLDLRDWTICLSLASIVLWADEAKKLLARLRTR